MSNQANVLTRRFDVRTGNDGQLHIVTALNGACLCGVNRNGAQYSCADLLASPQVSASAPAGELPTVEDMQRAIQRIHELESFLNAEREKLQAVAGERAELEKQLEGANGRIAELEALLSAPKESATPVETGGGEAAARKGRR